MDPKEFNFIPVSAIFKEFNLLHAGRRLSVFWAMLVCVNVIRECFCDSDGEFHTFALFPTHYQGKVLHKFTATLNHKGALG